MWSCTSAAAAGSFSSWSLATTWSTFARAAVRSSLAWIALSMAATGRTLVEGTSDQTLR